MIEFVTYSSLRVKLLESCQLRCRFCHFEGNQQARVADLDEVVHSAEVLRERLGLDKIHLTGGEPTLYPHLLELIESLNERGFRIAMTSHGLFDPETESTLAEFLSAKKLSYINFSVHTLSAHRYVVLNRLPRTAKTLRQADENLRTIVENLTRLCRIGEARINCVAAEDDDSLAEVYDLASRLRVDFRLVPDWTALQVAYGTVARFLDTTAACFSRFVVVHPTSNYSVRYCVDGVERIGVKLIRPVGLQSMCSGCDHAPLCTEFFGNLRLEGRPLQVRLCIHRQGAPYTQLLADFLNSQQFSDLRNQLRTPFDKARVDSTQLSLPWERVCSCESTIPCPVGSHE